MSINANTLFKIACVAVAISLLTACAAGKMFMAGYTPPQTIADLLNEQYALAGELPPELDPDKRGNAPISLANNSDIANEDESLTLSPDDYYALEAPVQRFNPRFTYKSVQDYAGQLAMALVKHSNGLGPSSKIGISSFVKLDTSLQNTTILGNQLAEYSISEMQQFGLHIIDFKLMPALQVRSNGDIAFSRDVLSLASTNKMNHVLSGTMIEREDGVFVNARIIALNSNVVVSSASILIPNFVAQRTQARYVSYASD